MRWQRCQSARTAPASRPVGRVRTALTTLVAAVAAAALSTAPASAADTWTEVGSDRANPLTESQGLTSVEVPAKSQPLHGSRHDPLQRQQPRLEPRRRPRRLVQRLLHRALPEGLRQLQDVPRPGTRRCLVEYVHQLSAGEALNNSWVAINPNGQFMVGGEWGTMSRFIVYPTPGVNSGTSPSVNLPQASTVVLDRPVRDIQGCDFSTPTTLLCSSDDPAGTLFGMTKPLLQVDLSGEPNGSADVRGHVTALRQLPLRSSCSGTFEAEGIDYDRRTGTLRVIVLSPGFCVATDSKTYRFTRG